MQPRHAGTWLCTSFQTLATFHFGCCGVCLFDLIWGNLLHAQKQKNLLLSGSCYDWCIPCTYHRKPGTGEQTPWPKKKKKHAADGDAVGSHYISRQCTCSVITQLPLLTLVYVLCLLKYYIYICIRHTSRHYIYIHIILYKYILVVSHSIGEHLCPRFLTVRKWVPREALPPSCILCPRAVRSCRGRCCPSVPLK